MFQRGFVLRLLLFARYTRDISQGFSEEFLYLRYADDLQLHVRFPLAIIHQVFARMSDHAELVSNWARANKLRLNMAKTNAIVMASYYFINELAIIITLGYIVIKLESSMRSLSTVNLPSVNQVNFFLLLLSSIDPQSSLSYDS